MRRAILVSVMAWLVPLSAAAQPGAAAAPVTQGPMIVEQIHSGFLAAPDVKVTEVDRKTSELIGGYAGWITDDTFFIGGGGYWLANSNRSDHEMAYGGLVVQWLARRSSRIGFGAKGLVGGGEATLSDSITITPRVPEFRTVNGRVPTPAPALVQRVRFREGFVIAEPEALLTLKLTKRMRLAGGVGYRFTGSERRGLGGDRLDGATGSVSLQIGGGS
jgi:hypothetical protein